MLLGGDLVLSGGLIKDANAANVWNLTSGDMTLAGNLTVKGGKIMDSSGRNVWDLANDTQTISNPNTTMTAGIIQGAGGNSWKLKTGELNLDFVPSGVVTTSQFNSAINSLEDDIDDCAWDINMARNVTDRISFTSAGMVIEGTNGQTQTVATYTSQGFVVDADMAEINCNQGEFSVKDWGMSYMSPDIGFWVTNGTSEVSLGNPNFHVHGPGFEFYVTADGAYANGLKLATV